MGLSISNTRVFEMAAYMVPSITVYNRLEATPRTANFDRSLKAEVRDPLWMLTRQWQFGEFRGEDAATALTTRILGEFSAIDTIHFPGNKEIKYDGRSPLEAVVESEAPAPTLAIAVQMSRYFIKLIRSKPGFDATLNQLITVFPLNFTIDPNDHDGLQLLKSVTGKTFDGLAFRHAIGEGSVPATILSTHSAEIEDYKKWFARNYPSSPGSAWIPSQLEYQFGVSSSSGNAIHKKLDAGHYPGGHLDWYSFDISESKNPPSREASKDEVQSYIPTPLTFKGMPLPRFWMMEDSYTDFGTIDTTPTGLLHLLLAEFSLTCSNDWFILPYQLSVNTLCEIKGILVKDVFGGYAIIRPAGTGAENQWQRWSMFRHTHAAVQQNSGSNLLYLVPAVAASLESPRLEQVNFLRDEMANLVWAVENIVPSQSGNGADGNQMALETDIAAPRVEGENLPPVRYILGTTVPHNWIPFIPVRIDANSAEIQLQRAKLPNSKGAMGNLLTEKKAPYFIEEKMLDFTGLLVSRSAQMARFLNGSTHSWVGRKKEAGKGEGWSNLRFDQIENYV